MKDKKGIIISVLIIVVLIYSGLCMFTDIFHKYILLDYIMLFLIFVIGIVILRFALKINKMDFTSKDKLFNSLVQSPDSVYILVHAKSKKVVYLSKNVEEVLGISIGNKSLEDVVFRVINIPAIKNEINSWDRNTEYVSQMVAYDNPKYNHEMWIKVKLFVYREKNEEYYVIRILDATKEHRRQHLLISQAADIKSHESILNQITTKSYDLEMNINLTLNSYELKYFKKDNLYFGEEKRGKYTEELNKLLEYINESDRELVYSNLNIETLKEHFTIYELDSIAIRYRMGN